VVLGVIQAPKMEHRIMRYELTDDEWSVIKPMLSAKILMDTHPASSRR
jgi:hypothetical protein